MKKKIFVAMMIGCMILGGCGGSGDSTATTDGDNYEAEYDVEDNALETNDGVVDENTEVEEETEAETKPAEAKGIIAMIQELDRNRAVATAQVIAIDPENGQQSIISEFTMRCPTTSEIQSDESLDDSELRFFFPAFNAEMKPSGNHREWFSQDFDKMIATRVFVDRNSEQHAGWVDTDGNYFDVSEATGMIPESSFSNTAVIEQTATGFDGDDFIFCEEADEGHICYSVPVSNVSDSAAITLDSQYGYYENLYHGVVIAYPTDWINEQECFADLYDHSDSPSGIRANIETGEFTEYLPESERCNWSGILDRDGDTVAFLSTTQYADGVVELYTMPISGGEPEKIQLVPNDELVLDTTNLTQEDLYGSVYKRNYTDCYFCLLEWR